MDIDQALETIIKADNSTVEKLEEGPVKSEIQTLRNEVLN